MPCAVPVAHPNPDVDVFVAQADPWLSWTGQLNPMGIQQMTVDSGDLIS